MGIGIATIRESVMISVVVNTVNILRVFEHCVKKTVIGAQLKVQCRPHWNTVAKKNAKLHAVTSPIMTQPSILMMRTWPKIRHHKNKMDNLMRTKVIFSVVWNPYLY